MMRLGVKKNLRLALTLAVAPPSVIHLKSGHRHAPAVYATSDDETWIVQRRSNERFGGYDASQPNLKFIMKGGVI